MISSLQHNDMFVLANPLLIMTCSEVYMILLGNEYVFLHLVAHCSGRLFLFYRLPQGHSAVRLFTGYLFYAATLLCQHIASINTSSESLAIIPF